MQSAQAAGEGEGTPESADDARWTHDVRIRALARREHGADSAARWRRGAWFAALLLHVVLIVALRHTPPLRVDAAAEQAIEVDLLEAPPPPPPQPEPPAPSVARERVEQRPRAEHPAAPAAGVAAERPVAADPRLFAPDGTAMIPDDMAAQLDRERKQAEFPAGPVPSPLFARKRPLKVRPNHFAQFWDDTDSLPLHDRIWRYVTATHEFTAPWGGRWKCAYVLMIVACADVPDKPWIAPQTWKPATELDAE